MDKSKLKQGLNFCYGFFGMLLIMGCVYLWDNLVGHSYSGLLTLLATIPLAFVGIVLWLILRNKNQNLAIGFLIGGLAPLIFIFILFRGCGIF